MLTGSNWSSYLAACFVKVYFVKTVYSICSGHSMRTLNEFNNIFFLCRLKRDLSPGAEYAFCINWAVLFMFSSLSPFIHIFFYFVHFFALCFSFPFNFIFQDHFIRCLFPFFYSLAGFDSINIVSASQPERSIKWINLNGNECGKTGGKQ